MKLNEMYNASKKAIMVGAVALAMGLGGIVDAKPTTNIVQNPNGKKIITIDNSGSLDNESQDYFKNEISDRLANLENSLGSKEVKQYIQTNKDASVEYLRIIRVPKGERGADHGTVFQYIHASEPKFLCNMKNLTVNAFAEVIKLYKDSGKDETLGTRLGYWKVQKKEDDSFKVDAFILYDSDNNGIGRSQKIEGGMLLNGKFIEKEFKWISPFTRSDRIYEMTDHIPRRTNSNDSGTFIAALDKKFQWIELPDAEARVNKLYLNALKTFETMIEKAEYVQ